MNPPRSSSFGQRLLALVPASLPPVATRRLPRPVRQLVGRVRTAVQDALDLPSRTELRQVMTHLETVTRRLDDMDQHSATQAPAAKPAASVEPAPKAQTLEEERKKLKKLRKELKRELKTVAGKRTGKKRKKTKTTINVGSPKSMKERAKKKSKKD